MSVTVECAMHGPMRYRHPTAWWECLGFDGEGSQDCGVKIVYLEDAGRAVRSGSEIPGVIIRP